MASDELKLRRMRRAQLIEIIYALQQNNVKLKEELEEQKQMLENRELAMTNAGSIAEASLHLSGIFEDAQKAADQYLASVQGMSDGETDGSEIIRDAEKQAAEIIQEAERKARRIVKKAIKQGKAKGRAKVKEAMQQAELQQAEMLQQASLQQDEFEQPETLLEPVLVEYDEPEFVQPEEEADELFDFSLPIVSLIEASQPVEVDAELEQTAEEFEPEQVADEYEQTEELYEEAEQPYDEAFELEECDEPEELDEPYEPEDAAFDEQTEQSLETRVIGSSFEAPPEDELEFTAPVDSDMAFMDIFSKITLPDSLFPQEDVEDEAEDAFAEGEYSEGEYSEVEYYDEAELEEPYAQQEYADEAYEQAASFEYAEEVSAEAMDAAPAEPLHDDSVSMIMEALRATASANAAVAAITGNNQFAAVLTAEPDLLAVEESVEREE